MRKAEQLKMAADARERRNSGMFTQTQQDLLRELRLLEPDKSVAADQAGQCCNDKFIRTRIKPSRSMMRVRLTRR